MNFVSNIIWNSVEGFVEAGTRTAGGYAGDALIRAGDMIENYGRGVGTSVESAAVGYGAKVTGQAPAKAIGSLPKTPLPKKKPAGPVRSNSSPAATTTKKTPVGANKSTGAKQINSAASTAKKQVSGTKALPKPYPNNIPYPSSKAVGDAKSSISQMPKKPLTGPKALPKPYPNNIPYPSSKTAGDSKAKTGGNINPVKDNSLKKELPKPYPDNSSNYHGKYPGTEKKTPVRAGQKNTFGSSDPKPYPGTSTYPGSEKKTAVKPQKYKPLERMKPPAETGKVQHISIA